MDDLQGTLLAALVILLLALVTLSDRVDLERWLLVSPLRSNWWVVISFMLMVSRATVVVTMFRTVVLARVSLAWQLP